MYKFLSTIELEFVNECRSQESETTKHIYEALYSYNPTGVENAYINLLASDYDFSLRVLLKMLEEIQNTEDDINEQCESSVSNSQKNNRIKFNAFKSSCEYKKLQGYYGDVPISKFEKKVQEMFDNKEPCIISNYFFDVILSNLTFEQRERCEGSLLRLYISYFFVNNHCPSVIGGVLLEGGFIMENRILPLRTALSNNTKEGLYDVCKTKLSRQIIQKINVTIECFWVKRCVLLQRYQKLNGKSQFYDVIKTMHNNA